MSRKKNVTIFVIILAFLISGCSRRTYAYSLAQSVDNIAQVEICEYDWHTHTTTPLCVLDKETAISLLTEICGLKCKRHWGDHTTDYGDVVIYISYIDGTAEVIGQCNIAHVNKDGKWRQGLEYFGEEKFFALLMKYVDADVLPELSR